MESEERFGSPAEWLEKYRASGPAWLLERHGGDAIGAAYELATIRNASTRHVRPTPTRAEVRAALRTIAIDSRDIGLSAITLHCRALGLVLID